MLQPRAFSSECIDSEIVNHLSVSARLSTTRSPDVGAHLLVHRPKAELMVRGVLPLGEQTVIMVNVRKLRIDKHSHFRVSLELTFC
jgi:hypothetical protein